METKIKSTRKTTRKLPSISKLNKQSASVRLNRFKSSAILKNKKILSMIIGMIVVIIVIVLLTVLFKSVFIAAIINGEPISRLSLITTLEKQGGKRTLDNLITKKIILQEAKKKNLKITQSDIDSEINKIKVNLQNQGSTLDQALTSQGMTMSDLNDEIKIQIMINKMVGDVTVTEKEINEFVTANKGQMATGTTEAQFREQAVTALKQQKLQTKTQEFLKNLQDKAKVNRFVSF